MDSKTIARNMERNLLLKKKKKEIWRDGGEKRWKDNKNDTLSYSKETLRTFIFCMY